MAGPRAVGEPRSTSKRASRFDADLALLADGIALAAMARIDQRIHATTTAEQLVRLACRAVLTVATSEHDERKKGS